MTCRRDWRGVSLGVAVLTLTLAAGAFARAQEEPAPPSFPSLVELVTVDAVVLDDDGRPVPGLTRDDFVVLEDGSRQEIATFEAFDLGLGGDHRPAVPEAIASNLRGSPPGARAFFVLVDDLGLAPTRIELLQGSLTRFIDAGLRDGDEVILATTSGETWWAANVPEGTDDLKALVSRMRGRRLSEQAADWMSDWEAYQIDTYADWREARGSVGGPFAGSDGPPLSQNAPQASVKAQVDIVGRVVERWLGRNVCDEHNPDMCANMARTRAREQDLLRRNRTRASVEVIAEAISALAPVRGRKSLLFFSEGFLNDHELTIVRDVAERSLEANVAVYFLGLRGLQATTSENDASALGQVRGGQAGPVPQQWIQTLAEQTTLEIEGSVGLAEDTGGFAVRSSNDLAAGAIRVAEESRVYYLLGYVPPPGKGERDWRKLKVEARKPGLKVRARKGYTLRGASSVEPAPGANEVGTIPATTTRALANAHDVDGIGLRAMALFMAPRSAATTGVTLAVGLDTTTVDFENEGKEQVATLELGVRVAQRDAGQPQYFHERLELPAGEEPGWPVLTRDIDLPAGVAQARIVVRDETTGRMGALTTRFEVPPPSGLRISTPILTDRITPARTGSPSQPVLVMRREFAPLGRLYCQFQVFGAANDAGATNVVASHELRRAGGAVLRRSPATLLIPAVDGRLIRMIGLDLGGLAEGGYELVLHVQDLVSGKTAESAAPFQLAGETS
jgi:VWFA-related protein